MSPEEYQRIKEAEKEHLRKLKKLKEAVHRLEQQKRVNRSISSMTSGRDDVLDTHQEMLDQLALETAQQEARLEMALENQAREEEAAEVPEQLEEELLEARAKTLLQQIKRQMGVAEEDPAATAAPPSSGDAASAAPAREEPSENPPSSESPPEKTIGRMK